LYGYEPNVGLSIPLDVAGGTEAVDILKEREMQTAILREQLAHAQNRMKTQADRLRTDRSFQVGDQLLLKLQPYAQQSVVNRPYPKLSFKFFGPYTVVEKIGAAAYRLDLPPGSLVHPVFHISQLKPFTPDYTPVYSDLSKLVDLDSVSLEREAVLDRRMVKKR
jgi:hypothetical protein